VFLKVIKIISSFIQASTNRLPLNCGKDQLALILSHHQVSASFLDFVFTFRPRDESETLTAFRHENFLDNSNSRYAIPHLGRSGIRLQHCFNLVSVEYDQGQDEWPWPLRQTAMYHSFDLVEGKAFWISLKGNKVVRERITQATSTHSQLMPGTLTTPEQKFVATLVTHLILFNWCVENWPRYIDFLEQRVKEHSIKVQFTPVAALSAPEPIERAAIARRANTMSTTGGHSRQGTFHTTKSMQSSRIPRLVRKFSERCPIHKKKAARPQTPQKAGAINELDLDRMFDFTELQNLSHLGDDIQTSLMVIEQDVRVMNEIMGHYSDIIVSPEFGEHIKVEKCKTDTKNFFVKGQQSVRDMENNARRLKNIARSLENATSQVSWFLHIKHISRLRG
jgi:hypothetical protein